MAYRDVPPVSTSKNRFSEVMARCGDRELVAIVEGPADDWQPEALAAAHAEIARRALAFEVRDALSREVEAIDVKARTRLERGARLLCAAAGALGIVPGLAVVLVYSSYQRRGFRRKARDLGAYYGYGLLAHVLLLLAYILASR